MSKFALFFLLLFTGGVFSTLFSTPVVGFYLYELIYFMNPNSRWWSADIPELSYSFAVVIVMMAAFFYKQKEFYKNTAKTAPAGRWIVLLLLSYLLAWATAVNPEAHQRFLFELVKSCAVMFVAYRMMDSENKLSWALLAYVFGCAYIGLEAYNTGRDGTGRVEGIGMVDSPDANTTAASIVPSIPLVLYFLWHGNTKIKVIIGIAGVLIANGLVLINSRGAFLGGVVAGGYFIAHMMFSKYKLPKQKFFIVVIIIGVVGIGIRLTDAAFWERMGTIESSSSKEAEGSGGRRINFWLATFDMMKDHPLGVGIYGYQALSPIYLDKEEYFSDVKEVDGVKLRAVHSIWCQTISEVGWHGMLFFLIMLLKIYSLSADSRKKLIACREIKQVYFLVAIEAGLLGYLVAGTFIDALRLQVLSWFVIFSMCAINMVANGSYAKSGNKEVI